VDRDGLGNLAEPVTIIVPSSMVDFDDIERRYTELADANFHGQSELDYVLGVQALLDEVIEQGKASAAGATARASADLDEARQLARDLWQMIPTASKLQIFEKSDGWVPAWIRPGSKAD
jgi:hypothetical protein